MIIFFFKSEHSCNLTNKRRISWGFLLTYKCWWTKPQFDFLNRIEKIKNIVKFIIKMLGFYSCPSSDPFASASVNRLLQ